ncbi:MAG: hypothetical protein ABIU54_08870 [Candidatus Eisenbacteria bacterium]
MNVKPRASCPVTHPCAPKRYCVTRAAHKGSAPEQLALAWVLAQGEDIVPIPRAKRRRWLAQNVGATAVTQGEEDRL